MEVKDTWRGMKVPADHSNAFFQWDNKKQAWFESDAKTVLAVLELTPEAQRDMSWKSAERAVLDAPLYCRPAEVNTIPNLHGFPHWDMLRQFQKEKANQMVLSEKDFRDYDPDRAGRSMNREWDYASPCYVIQDTLAYQRQCSFCGRFMAWTDTIPGFWGGMVGGLILMFVFWVVWNLICPITPPMTPHEAEVQAIVNPYYYSSWTQYAIGKFWGSVITFTVGFATGAKSWGG